MVKLTLYIRKKKVFNSKLYRYYEIDRIQVVPGIDLLTEAELAYYIFRRFGEGRYSVLATCKGNEGFFGYWVGDLTEFGFCRDRKTNKDMEKLQKELHQAQNFEEREIVEEEIDFEREITKEIRSTKKPPCWKIKKSPVGILNSYEQFYQNNENEYSQY